MKAVLLGLLFSLLVTAVLSYFPLFDEDTAFAEYINNDSGQEAFNPHLITGDPESTQEVIITRQGRTGLYFKVSRSATEGTFSHDGDYVVTSFEFQFLSRSIRLQVRFEEPEEPFRKRDVSAKVFSWPTDEELPCAAKYQAVDLTYDDAPIAVEDIENLIRAGIFNGMRTRLHLGWVHKIFHDFNNPPRRCSVILPPGFRAFIGLPCVIHKDVLKKLRDLKNEFPYQEGSGRV